MTDRKSVSDDQTARTGKVKVALVVSGAIALGSFESGVVTELVRAAQDPNSPIEIDVIGGASAGAITGAAVAYYITRRTRGGEGDKAYRAFSVWKEIDLEKLTQYSTGGSGDKDNALLSRSILDQQMSEVLESQKEAPPDPALHTNDVLLFVTMCSLHGRPKPVRGKADGDGVFVDIRYQNHSESVYVQIPARPDQGAQWGGRAGENARPDEVGADVPQQAEKADDERRFWYKIFNYSLTSAALTPAWAPARHYDFTNRPDIWWPNGALLQAEAKAHGKLYFVDGGFNDNRPILKMLDKGLALRRLMEERKEAGRPLDLASVFEPDPNYSGRNPIRSLVTPVDPDRMILFIEPDPIEKDKVDPAHPKDSYDNFLDAVFRAKDVLGRANPTYTDLQWVGFVNSSLVTTFEDVLREMQELRDLRQENEALKAALEQQQKARAGDAAVDIAISLQAQPQGAEYGLTRRGKRAPRKLQKAVDSFFERWCADPAALDRAALSRVCKTESGNWRPLDQLQPVRRMAEIYAALGESERRQLRERLADALEQRRLGSSTWVYVDRIAPKQNEQPLARTVGHFGGFAEQAWMAYDYDLGRKVALEWMKETFGEDHCPEMPPELAELKPPTADVSTQTVVRTLMAKHSTAVGRMLLHALNVLDRSLEPGRGGKTGRWLDRAVSWVRKSLDFLASRAFLWALLGTVAVAGALIVWLPWVLAWFVVGTSGIALGLFIGVVILLRSNLRQVLASAKREAPASRPVTGQAATKGSAPGL